MDAYDLAYDVAKELIPTHLFETSKRFTEAVGYLANTITRAKEDMTKHSEVKLRACKKYMHVALTRVATSGIVLRGDYRYDSKDLTKFLVDNPKLELPPIQIGRTNNQLHLLDGHHRYRAYVQAHRKPLAFIVEIHDLPPSEDTPYIELAVDV